MNPAVFQPGGPGGEEEEGSFHTRISHPHPTFSYLLVYAEHGILPSWTYTFGTSILSVALFLLLIHHTDWIDGIVSRWRSEEC